MLICFKVCSEWRIVKDTDGVSSRKRGERYRNLICTEAFYITELFHTPHCSVCAHGILIWGMLGLGVALLYIRIWQFFTRQLLAPIVNLSLNSLFSNRKMCYPSPAKNPPLSRVDGCVAEGAGGNRRRKSDKKILNPIGLLVINSVWQD